MANGKLGSVSPAASTYTTVFQATSNKVTTFNLGVCNTSGNALTFRLAISAANPPVDGEFIEWEVSVPGNGTYERTALVASGGEYVVIYASGLGLNVRAWGFEQ